MLALRGAVNAADSKGEVPLHCAARSSTDLVLLLLGHGADSRAADSEGWTPIHEASHWSDARAVQALLQHGANVRCASKEGETPLHVVPGGYGDAGICDVLVAVRTVFLVWVSLDVASGRGGWLADWLAGWRCVLHA